MATTDTTIVQLYAVYWLISWLSYITHVWSQNVFVKQIHDRLNVHTV